MQDNQLYTSVFHDHKNVQSIIIEMCRKLSLLSYGRSAVAPRPATGYDDHHLL